MAACGLIAPVEYEALTIARMPVFRSADRWGQAAARIVRSSGSFPTAAPSAALFPKVSFLSGFLPNVSGIIIRVSGVRIPPLLLSHPVAMTGLMSLKPAIRKGLGVFL